MVPFLGVMGWIEYDSGWKVVVGCCFGRPCKSKICSSLWQVTFVDVMHEWVIHPYCKMQLFGLYSFYEISSFGLLEIIHVIVTSVFYSGLVFILHFLLINLWHNFHLDLRFYWVESRDIRVWTYSFHFLFPMCSCVPLYNFNYVYNYVMGSPRSFVDR